MDDITSAMVFENALLRKHSEIKLSPRLSKVIDQLTVMIQHWLYNNFYRIPSFCIPQIMYQRGSLESYCQMPQQIKIVFEMRYSVLFVVTSRF